MKPQDHQKLIWESITKTYQKARDMLSINIKVKSNQYRIWKKIAKAYKLKEKISPTKNRDFHNFKRS